MENDKIQPKQKKALAIASLVFGIIGGSLSTLSIPAIICGHIALVKIKKDSRAYGGRGMAIAGLIFGYFGLVLAIANGIMGGLLKIQLRNMGYW